MAFYGSGPGLDENFDFDVDRGTGDIKPTLDDDELRKDLAFRLASAVRYGRGVSDPPRFSNGILGERMDDDTLRDSELVISRIATDDPRIESVERVTVSSDGSFFTRLEIDLTLIAVDGGVVDFDRIIEPDDG